MWQTTRSVPGFPHATCHNSRTARDSDLEHNLAELLAPLEARVCFRAMSERQHLVNHRLHEAARNEFEHGIELRFRAHVRSENRNVPREEIAEIELPFPAARCAASDE